MNRKKDRDKLQKDLESMETWIIINKLRFNSDKCKAICLGEK